MKNLNEQTSVGLENESNNNINNRKEAAESRQLAGLFRQVLILFWKNWTLFRRSVFASCCEVVIPYLLIVLLIVLRSTGDAYFTKGELYPPTGVTQSFSNGYERSLIFFYPNNFYVRSIITRSIMFMEPDAPFLFFNFRCKLK